MKLIKRILLGFAAFFLVSLFLPNYFFSTDILNTIPIFSVDTWNKPHNSLLADPVFQFEPWRHYAKERLSKLELPFINDRNGGGVPFFANPQAGVLSPFNIIYFLFPRAFSLHFIHFLKLFIFGFFTFLYAKKIGVKKEYSFLVALSAVSSGFFITWLQWPHTSVFLFVPVVLYITERAFLEKNAQYRFLVLLSISITLAYFAGHPETFFHLLMIHFFYTFLRFRENRSFFFKIVFASGIGISVSAIQLFPFLEYLFHSSVLENRLERDNYFFLPLKSLVLYIFPFLFGAPHTSFYRPIASFTNFQEVISGYVGAGVLSFSLVGFILKKTDKMVQIWITVVAVSFLLAYNIWPFNYINELPVISASANHRMSAFVSFGICILFGLTLDNVISFLRKKISSRSITVIIILVGIFFVVEQWIASHVLQSFPARTQEVIQYIAQHILYILITSILFLFLYLFINNKKKYSFVFFALSIFLQSTVLFVGYNTVFSKQSYYPVPRLIQKLQSLPKGRYIEIGNPSIPENINSIYGLHHIGNDDALEIRRFKEAFDAEFPQKNEWKNPEHASLPSLQKFGIQYVISDYDIRFTRDVAQSKKSQRFPLTHDVSVPLVAKNMTFAGIRILTANHNRVNTCSIHFSLADSMKKVLTTTKVQCSQVRDLMRHFVKFPEVKLKSGEKYQLIVEPKNISDENYISLWGDSAGQPYLEVFYENEKTLGYTLLYKDQASYLFHVSSSQEITFGGVHSILSQKPERILLETASKQESRLEIKIPNYPGWAVRLDGKPHPLNTNPLFLSSVIPEGQHVVEFSYKPFSLLLGAIITFFTGIFGLIYILRNLRNEVLIKKLHQNWIRWVQRTVKSTRWWHNVIVLIGGLIVGMLLFIAVAEIIPIRFMMPETTAINWYTVHKYPRQQEYFYFFFGFSFILIITIFIWSLWIWKKQKK